MESADMNNILGWMTNQECDALADLAKLVPDSGTIVEVGSMFGRSATIWAQSNPTVTVICIDTFIENYHSRHDIDWEICHCHKFPLNGITYNLYEEFQKNTQHYDNIKIIRGYSPQNIQYTGQAIDLFFLDAGHSNPNDWDNIEFFLPYIKSGGKICGHDYDKIFPDVIDNVERLEKMLGKTVTVFKNTSIWMIEK